MTDRLILWGIVISYMLFVFIKGVLKVRKVGTTDDFLVAGRNVPWFLLFATMGATVIGGGYSIGAIGKTYEWGILMLLVSMGGYLHFIFSGLVVAPQFRRAELYTVAGYFGHRYGEGPRFLVLILSLLFSVFIVAAQMAAFGSVLAAIMPGVADMAYALRWAIFISGIMVVTYSTAGGLLAVIHTDVYQFIVLFLGFVITLGFCIPDIADSYNAETGKFVPSRFSAVDIVNPVSLSAKLQDDGDSLAVYLQDKLAASSSTADEVRAAETADSAATGEAAPAGELVAGLNGLLDDPLLYSPEAFAGVRLTPQTRELLSEGASGRTLRRRNLSLLQDAFPTEITRNRMIPGVFFKVEGGKGWLFLLTTFLAFLLGETFAPGYATRYCVGRNIKETRLGIAGVGFFLAITFPVILFFIALYARIHFPDIDPQQALPMVVEQLHNPVIGGLMIGALLMAVMSSADSALNSATAIFVKDLFEHQLGWKDQGDGRMLRLARICTAVLGLTAILVAILWSDIIGLLLFTYHVWAPAIILPVVVGVVYKKRSRHLTRNIMITMLAATGLTLLYRAVLFLQNKFGWFPISDNAMNFMENFDPAVFGVAVSCIAYLILLAVSRIRREDI
ncbi:MAG: sodium:solute symporter family protein [Candidatus Eisenbacteria bacterium]|uniref:Sodium:solute symporter family protein n=1 Tax=Eiseniibacteriota bacterium TaxID=2212470 RepID=A0A948RUE4_UNCEI|nr:sodium:solute symporter family protein [Candidatus Eisenbacteria bacterium]MBU1948060.1 sodium:solute symporter family protein [Candidatus Eisenbacteria bacterium]MBU2689879.1 sodium:solute symporter family protein [Candidatus Eisenbacteria bacterium]